MPYALNLLEQTPARALRIDDRVGFGSQQQGFVSTAQRSRLWIHICNASQQLQSECLNKVSADTPAPQRQGLLSYDGPAKQSRPRPPRPRANESVSSHQPLPLAAPPPLPSPPCTPALTTKRAPAPMAKRPPNTRLVSLSTALTPRHHGLRKLDSTRLQSQGRPEYSAYPMTLVAACVPAMRPNTAPAIMPPPDG